MATSLENTNASHVEINMTLEEAKDFLKKHERWYEHDDWTFGSIVHWTHTEHGASAACAMPKRDSLSIYPDSLTDALSGEPVRYAIFKGNDVKILEEFHLHMK